MPKKTKTKTEDGHVELCKWATTYKQLYRIYIYSAHILYSVWAWVYLCEQAELSDRWTFFWLPNDRHFIIVSFGECVIHHANNRSLRLCLRPCLLSGTACLPAHMTCWACIWVVAGRRGGGRRRLGTGNYCCRSALSFGRRTWNAINQVDINRLDF